MSEHTTSKRCAICSEIVEQGEIQCPKCGRGLFEATKHDWAGEATNPLKKESHPTVQMRVNRDGDSVKCQKCGTLLTVVTRTSPKAITLTTYDAVKAVAFRCQDCGFITCSSCATGDVKIQGGMMVCPACNSGGGPSFFE